MRRGKNIQNGTLVGTIMKQLRLFLFLVFAMFSIHGVAASKSESDTAQTHRTVRDYYVLLPSSYFLESPRENLRKRSMVVDIANDYIETSGEAGQPYLQTSLFRYGKAELFAVYAQFDKGDVLTFYRLRNGRLQDVTRQVWRVKSHAHDRVYLSRHGTSIVIRDETYPGDEKTRLVIRWRGGRFVK